MTSARPQQGKELFLDILTKEEKEALLTKKMEEIKKKNETLRKRHAEIEADKQRAEQMGTSAAPVTPKSPSGPVPEPRSPKQREMKGVNSAAENKKGSKFSTGRGKKLQQMGRERLKAQDFEAKNRGRGINRNPSREEHVVITTQNSEPRNRNRMDNRPANRRQDNDSYRTTTKPEIKCRDIDHGWDNDYKSTREIRGRRGPPPIKPDRRDVENNNPDAPPPDPSFNFLSDRSREGPVHEVRREPGKRHPRNFGGTDFQDVQNKMQAVKEKAFTRRGPPRSKMEMSVQMTGRERREYTDWRNEREQINRERIERQKRNDGTWSREWDNDKMELDYDDYGPGGRKGFEPGRRPAGRIGSGRFDRGERDDRQRGEAPGQKVRFAQDAPPAPARGRGGRGAGRGVGRGGGGPRSANREAPGPISRTRVLSSGSDDRSVEQNDDSLVIKIENEFAGGSLRRGGKMPQDRQKSKRRSRDFDDRECGVMRDGSRNDRANNSEISQQSESWDNDMSSSPSVNNNGKQVTVENQGQGEQSDATHYEDSYYHYETHDLDRGNSESQYDEGQSQFDDADQYGGEGQVYEGEGCEAQGQTYDDQGHDAGQYRNEGHYEGQSGNVGQEIEGNDNMFYEDGNHYNGEGQVESSYVEDVQGLESNADVANKTDVYDDWADGKNAAAFYGIPVLDDDDDDDDEYEDVDESYEECDDVQEPLNDGEQIDIPVTDAVDDGYEEDIGSVSQNNSLHLSIPEPSTPTSPHTPDSVMKTPSDHVNVFNWAAEVDEAYDDSTTSDAAERLQTSGNSEEDGQVKGHDDSQLEPAQLSFSEASTVDADIAVNSDSVQAVDKETGVNETPVTSSGGDQNAQKNGEELQTDEKVELTELPTTTEQSENNAETLEVKEETGTLESENAVSERNTSMTEQPEVAVSNGDSVQATLEGKTESVTDKCGDVTTETTRPNPENVDNTDTSDTDAHTAINKDQQPATDTKTNSQNPQNAENVDNTHSSDIDAQLVMNKDQQPETSSQNPQNAGDDNTSKTDAEGAVNTDEQPEQTGQANQVGQ